MQSFIHKSVAPEKDLTLNLHISFFFDISIAFSSFTILPPKTTMCFLFLLCWFNFISRLFCYFLFLLLFLVSFVISCFFCYFLSLLLFPVSFVIALGDVTLVIQLVLCLLFAVFAVFWWYSSISVLLLYYRLRCFFEIILLSRRYQIYCLIPLGCLDDCYFKSSVF